MVQAQLLQPTSCIRTPWSQLVGGSYLQPFKSSNKLLNFRACVPLQSAGSHLRLNGFNKQLQATSQKENMFVAGNFQSMHQALVPSHPKEKMGSLQAHSQPSTWQDLIQLDCWNLRATSGFVGSPGSDACNSSSLRVRAHRNIWVIWACFRSSLWHIATAVHFTGPLRGSLLTQTFVVWRMQSKRKRVSTKKTHSQNFRLFSQNFRFMASTEAKAQIWKCFVKHVRFAQHHQILVLPEKFPDFPQRHCLCHAQEPPPLGK